MPRPRKDLRLVKEISARITSGIYQPGERLPSVRLLCLEFSVSPSTMQKALGLVQDAGLVEARHGSGWYVTHDHNSAQGDIADTHLMMSINYAHLNRPYLRIMVHQLIEQYVAQHGKRFFPLGATLPNDTMSLIELIKDSPAPHILMYDAMVANLQTRNDFWVLLGELQKRIVLFTFGAPPHVTPFDTVAVSWTTGTEAGVDALVKQGHTRLLYVGYDGVSWSDQRRGGFLRALRRHKLWEFGQKQPCLSVHSTVIERPDLDDAETAAHVLLDYLRSHEIDGVICAQDQIIEDVYALGTGDSLPPMIGHDNSVWAAEHGISSISINARLFVDELFSLLALPPSASPRQVAVPTMLIERWCTLTS